MTIEGDREHWAIRLSASRTGTDGPVTTTESYYDYVKVAECDPEQRIFQCEAELLSELADAGVTDPQTAAEAITQDWIAGMDMLHADPAIEVAIDPMTGTVELLDEIQRTAYSISSSENA